MIHLLSDVAHHLSQKRNFVLLVLPVKPRYPEPVPDGPIRNVSHSRKRPKLRGVDVPTLVQDILADVNVLDVRDDKGGRSNEGRGVDDVHGLQELQSILRVGGYLGKEMGKHELRIPC